MNVAHDSNAQVFIIDMNYGDVGKAEAMRLFHNANLRHQRKAKQVGYGYRVVFDALQAQWLENFTKRDFRASEAGKWLTGNHTDYLIVSGRYKDILSGLVTIMILDPNEAMRFKLTFSNAQMALAA